MERRLVHIKTFGCQMNEYDSERILALLGGGGYEGTDDPEEADLIVLNTCSVRAKPEQKAYSYLGRLRKLKKTKPDLESQPDSMAPCFRTAKERFERQFFVNLLERHSGNVSRAAREADMDRKNFQLKLKKYSLDKNEFLE